MTAKKILARDAKPPRKGQTVDPNNPMSPPTTLRRTKLAKAVSEDLPPHDNFQEMTGPVEQLGTVRPGVSTDEALRERHTVRRGWFLTEARRQASNRLRMARCEAFYDSEQWGYDDAQVLLDRGQDPVVYNEIKPTIDWLIGTERRTRIDFVVMAEDEGDDADDEAAAKTKVLKYLDDTNMAQFERSFAATSAFKAGIGWLEVGARLDPTGTPVFVGAESWRNILWDSHAQRLDLQDARYFFRVKVVDYDVALALFPDQKAELARCVQTGDTLQVLNDWLSEMGASVLGLDQFSPIGEQIDDITSRPIDAFNARKRVLLIECWERVPVRRKLTEGALGDPMQFRIRVSVMTEYDTLLESWSPYEHDRFPFIPIWAYRNSRTGLPYSPIWPLIGPQEALNKRMSKSLFEASSNQIEVEAGAVDAEVMDLQDLRAEYNDPNGMPVFRDGALASNKVRHVERGGKMAEQLALAEQDRNAIRSMSGVNADNRGMNSNVVSGKAVLAKQDQGSLLTAELFDNLLLARKLEGEITLSVVEQYMTQPRTIRVAEGLGKGERLKVNQPSVDEATGEVRFLNDLSRRRASFVVGEQAWKQAYAEAAFDSLFEVLSQLATAAPAAVINLLDLVFDMHPTLPKKRAIVQRIRQINGQSDPDAKLTPEEEAAKAQQKAIADAQFRLQMAQLQATVAEAQAKGEKLNADAIGVRLKAIYDAAQAAQALSVMPEVAPITDQLLRSAGMQDLDKGSDTYIDKPTAPPITAGAPAGPDASPDAAMAAGQAAPQPAPQGAQPGAM